MGGIKILSLDIIAGGRDHFGDHFEVGITTIYKITITGVVRTFDSSNLTVRDVMGGGEGKGKKEKRGKGNDKERKIRKKKKRK